MKIRTLLQQEWLFFTNRHRHPKSQGSAKINSYCTAAIILRSKQGYAHILEAEHCPAHYGQSVKLGHLRLQQHDRLAIAGKLFQGVTYERILDDIRDSVDQSIH